MRTVVRNQTKQFNQTKHFHALRNYPSEYFHMQKTAQLFPEKPGRKTYVEEKVCVEDKWPCPGMRSNMCKLLSDICLPWQPVKTGIVQEPPKRMRLGGVGAGAGIPAQKQKESEETAAFREA